MELISFGYEFSMFVLYFTYDRFQMYRKIDRHEPGVWMKKAYTDITYFNIICRYYMSMIQICLVFQSAIIIVL